MKYTLYLIIIWIPMILFPKTKSSIQIDPGSLIEYVFIDSMSAGEIYDNLADLLPFPPYGFDVSIYKLIYQTTDTQGNMTIASGALAIPNTGSSHVPLLSFQHGTVLERDQVASEYGFDILSMWLGTSGYVTALPDYLGLGVSEIFHPYIIADPSANSVIDMLRASREFCELLGVNLNDQVFLTGYSEGGYTTMAAHKLIEEEYIDEFNITASAPCAGPYDLSGVMVDLMLSGNEYDQPYYLPYTVLAYQDSYNIVENLHDYFLEFYADTLPILFDGYHSSNEVNSIMPSVPIEIFHPEVIEEFTNNMDHPLRVRLVENDLIYWAPQAPTILYHSDQDELVPVENSENAYFQFIFNGAPNVEFVHSPLGSHSDAAILIIFQVINWFNTLAQVGTLGDLNEDSIFDIQDIILLVNLVLDIMNTTYFYSWAGDLNSDGNLNIYDVILLITVILEAY